MEANNNFTFVETGIPTSRRGTSKGSLARSVIRSHAMQQVWEQRRQQRAQGHGDNNFKIVMENDKLKGVPKARAKPCLSSIRPVNGAVESMKKKPTRKVPRSNTVANVAKSSNTIGGETNRKIYPGGHPGGPSLRNTKGPLSSTLQIKHRADPSVTSAQSLWNSSQTTFPLPVGMCLMDPFDTCAVSLGPKESRYMTHYFQALSWRFTLPKRTWLRYAIHDPGLLHGVLAIAAAHYSFATTRGFSDDALFHHGKTINHVQRCLQDPVLRFSDGVIGAIGRMVICHLIFGNRHHFITHIQAIQRSTEARGGLESLGMVGQLKYIIASCVAGAATIWWEDVPSQLEYPYGPLDYPAVEDVPDAEARDPEWGSAFHQLNKIGFLSDKLLDICDAMNALNSVINSRRSWSEPQQRIFGDQCNKLSLRLIYLKQDEAISRCQKKTRDPHGHMRECVRLALHFYVTAFQRDVPLLSNISVQTLHQLKETLSLTDLEASWGGSQLGEVLLWVLIITASGSVRPQERVCAGTQLRKTATQLGVTQWPQVKRICRRFLFLDSAVEWKTWPVWKDFGPRLEDDVSAMRPEASILSIDERVVVVH